MTFERSEGLGARDELECERFSLVAELGRGAMGVVYRARDAQRERDVALKTLPELTADDVVALKDEFRAARDIVNPHVVALDELIVEPRRCFFTMELVDGPNLLGAVWGASTEPHFGPDNAGRLRRYFRELARGLEAIHAAGKLHLDIKPANVLVAGDDTVRILDFGLVRTIRVDPLRRDEGMTGTLVYMAPEQIMGRAANPAADAYSVGAMLFEALTGAPFATGPAHRIAREKLRGTSPKLSDLPPNIPRDLASITIDLMRADPLSRPTLSECVDRLQDEGVSPPAPIGAEPEFLGRVDELDRLRELTADSDAPRGKFIHVRGVSGIGKSALLSQLAQHLTSSGTLLLRSRCHPRESVANNAIDGIIDDIGRFLSLPDQVPSKMLGAVAAEDLIRLFPSLAPQFPEAEHRARVEDPVVARRRGVAALRELLSKISDVVPATLWIDDFQWGDADSEELLRALVARPNAPELHVLLSYRVEDLESSPLLARIARQPLETGSDYSSELLTLGPLTIEDGRELARRSLEKLGASYSPGDVDLVVAEASGSPFFIGELATAIADGVPADQARLIDALARRIERLPTGILPVLEVVALAAAPLTHRMVLQTAAVGAGDDPLRWMERSRLIRRLVRAERTPSTTLADISVVFHDRIREAVISQIPSSRLATLHAGLVETLKESAQPNFEALVVHSRGAGNRADEAGYAVEAADKAEAVFAFARAAELYGIAVDYRRSCGDLDAELATRHAGACANAGRGAEANESYQEAALLRSAAGASKAEVVELRRRAAMQLTRASGLEAGLTAQIEVLRDLGIRVPRYEGTALLAASMRRRSLRKRGYDFDERSPDEVPADERVRLDALWGAATSLGVQNFALADDLATRHLEAALRSGDRSRIRRALIQEATYEAHMHRGANAARARDTASLVETMGRSSDSPYDQAWVSMGHSMIHWAFGQWPRGRAHGMKALQIYRDQCPSSIWEMGLTRLYLFSSLAFCGELNELAPQLNDALEDARSRGDEHAADHYRVGHMSTVRLIHGREDLAFKLLAEAEARMPRKKMNSHRYHCLVLAMQADLYVGNPWSAWERTKGPWRDVRNLYFLQPTPWVELLHLRARCALAAAEALEAGQPTPTRGAARLRPRTLLKLVDRSAATIRKKYRLPASEAFASSLEAASHRLRGNIEGARAALRTAVAEYDKAGMRLHREAARLRLAEHTSDTPSPPQQAALEWMRGQAVANPQRLCDMLLPGLRPSDTPS